MKVLIKCRQT